MGRDLRFTPSSDADTFVVNVLDALNSAHQWTEGRVGPSLVDAILCKERMVQERTGAFVRTIELLKTYQTGDCKVEDEEGLKAAISQIAKPLAEEHAKTAAEHAGEKLAAVFSARVEIKPGDPRYDALNATFTAGQRRRGRNIDNPGDTVPSR